MRHRNAVVGIVAALFAIGLTGTAATAATPPPRKSTPPWEPEMSHGVKTPLHVRLNEARFVCNQPVIQVVFDTETLIGMEWTPKQDDGRTAVQVRFIGNGAPPGGYWGTVKYVSGGENRLRVNVATQELPTWDLMRLIRTDTHIASSGKPVADTCI